MILAIDLDGVTIATIKAWLKQFHPNFTKDDIKAWDAWKWVDSCDKKKFFDEFDRINPLEAELMEDARTTILSLAKKHEVFFLTTKTIKAEQWSRLVLRREGLAHIPLYNNWTDGKSKNDYEYDILLDDSPDHAYIERLVQFDQPWNQHTNVKRRVHSWKEFEDLIDHLEKNQT